MTLLKAKVFGEDAVQLGQRRAGAGATRKTAPSRDELLRLQSQQCMQLERRERDAAFKLKEALVGEERADRELKQLRTAVAELSLEWYRVHDHNRSMTVMLMRSREQRLRKVARRLLNSTLSAGFWTWRTNVTAKREAEARERAEAMESEFQELENQYRLAQRTVGRQKQELEARDRELDDAEESLEQAELLRSWAQKAQKVSEGRCDRRGAAPLYFTTVMNRVVLVAAPVVCILGGIGLSACLRYSFDILHGKQVLNPVTGKKTKPGDPGPLRFLALGLLGAVAVSASKYIQHAQMKGLQFSYPSIVIPSRNRDGGLAIIDDYREAYKWISQNTPEDAKILAWWDYGYQMTSMSNRTVLVDNNTWNNTHIATVGLALASPEERAVEIFERLDAEYALVIYGGRVGVQSDDISKAYWILKITSGEYPEINYIDYLNPRTGMISMGAEVTPAMKKSLLYKLVYHGLETPQHGYDYVRRQEVKNVEPLEHFEEVFSSTYFMVRVFKRKRHFGPAV